MAKSPLVVALVQELCYHCEMECGSSWHASSCGCRGATYTGYLENTPYELCGIHADRRQYDLIVRYNKCDLCQRQNKEATVRSWMVPFDGIQGGFADVCVPCVSDPRWTGWWQNRPIGVA